MSRHEGKPVTIVGLQNGGNGRNCSAHRICGLTIETGSVIRFLLTVAQRNDVMEYAIGAYRVDAGTTTCLVGFLPASLVPQWREYEDRISQVVEVDANATSYGSCIAMILPKETGVGDVVGDLPDIGSKMVDDSQAALFLGNKDAAKYLVNITRQKRKKRNT